MKSMQTDWTTYIAQMEHILGVALDDARRDELRIQFTRIAAMAEPLMAYPLDERQEVAGVYQP
ncbi:MAG: hypothetical protein XXXJIFNMEKO3_00788 [Candidatus Erwinia impunctatus]|nr:hypothetical protein XXXJIFNMEKO_00788 [Culicoides impunctatus]